MTTDFASDNHAGAHPEVIEAIAAANVGHAGSYGSDPWTERAEGVIRLCCGTKIPRPLPAS